MDGAGLKILVVDDDAVVRRALMRILKAENPQCEVEECGDGLEASVRLAGERWDGVFLDYRLPGRDGLEVLRKARGAGVDVPIVIFTGEGDEDLAVEMMRSGATDYVNKGRMTQGWKGRMMRLVESLKVAAARTKEAEAKHRRSEERFRHIFEGGAIGMVIVDLEGRIVDANPAVCEMVGRPCPELIGQHYSTMTYPDDRSVGRAEAEKLLAGKIGSYHVEKRFVHSSGRAVWAAISASMVRDEYGQPEYVLGLVEDIDERKRAEEEAATLREQLAQAQRLESVGRLAGGIAHDFNNLLAVIGGYAESLHRRVPADDAEGQKRLVEIERAAERGARLVKQLLAFSRHQTVRPVRMDLNESVRGVTEMLRPVIGREIEVRVSGHGGPAWIEADPGQVEQLVLNLALNARDAMPDGGTLTLETDVGSNGHVVLRVTDTGVGMDERTREHLFEPFFTTKATGTGLGLAVVYGIVQGHGGTIDVKSRPGEGTMFEVRLRRAA